MRVDAAAKCWPLMMSVLLLVSSILMEEIDAQVIGGNVTGKQVVAAMITGLTSEMQRHASFCTVDAKTDTDKAFNYSNWDFLKACMTETNGDAPYRLCNKEEIRFYLEKLDILSDGMSIPSNKNCNTTSWPDGCDPGWACSSGSVPNDQEIPARTSNPRSCCEGFFCPEGLTCMMPCPLGSYCPSAALNETTGLCEPYNYQLRNRTRKCGGANIWAGIDRSKEVFCPAGSYCPTTTEKRPCKNGHYCQTGSTSEKRCSKLISCKGNAEEQNIHTYGIMLIVALAALLLIIYNFSDQILSIRERRRAKTRERAIISVQQKERVQARWRFAKDATMEHAGKLHTNLTRRFSPRNHPENFNVLHDLEIQEYLSSSSTNNHARNSSDVQPSSISLENSNRPARLHVPENSLRSNDKLGLEIEGKNSKGKALKEKHIRTDSQIFKYAYAQIEKEKSQERQFDNLTFSGVISMATREELMKRPLIEIGFKDLTLTLKGKQRCLLKSLTGKIMPGHITAVMGPSGAGKTTLMSALAGKETGCKRSGLILINGKPDSIHSYKKIVGFVPQDDIVHGNLTVEENIRFSAWCRLSTKLPRADKVLIVERVLMNLGLQEVRDSLVGTVEKRGISGGQRKRVNVGLEMVIEPSLLFLDEPTSGLDSSSSRLLLKALKREALEGVNICMVVHQPSYALFKMFDDLILLAKGGLMVYHGSLGNAEEYFEGLGINVPERVNPPDHYIDILEGMVRPSPSSNFSYKDLPLTWMLHNGYSIPEDMQSRAAELGNSRGSGSEFNGSADELQSITSEIWQDLRCNVEQRRDHIHHYFLNSKDLANRRTPGVIRQYQYFLGRITKQRLREAKLLATDYLILLLAGACLGVITKMNDTDFGAGGYTFTIIAISLLCQIASLRTFSMDKLQYLRESASGISSLAHFLAKDTIDHFNTAIKPVVYLSMFYFFTNPRSTFIDNYIVLLCLVYCVTGMGYAFAIFFNPGPAQLFSVLLPVCLTLISSQSLKNDSLKGIAKLCYPKWALEALVIANAKRYYGVWLIQRCLALKKMGYDLHAWRTCILILIAYGMVSRVIAFIALLIIRKK